MRSSLCFNKFLLKILKRSKFSLPKSIFFVFILGFIFINSTRISVADPFKVKFSEKPDHVILYIIDGLSYKAWNRIKLPVLMKMIENGALVERNYLPPSAHPTQGAYADLHTCSIPNPVLMAGTLFITKETQYLPQCFFPQKTTAFVANTEIYSSLNKFYHYSYQKLGPDPEGVEKALAFMRMGKPVFMRVHLQEVGEASFQIMKIKEDVPWRGNIWAKGSPYVEMLKKADALLKNFLDGLEMLSVLSKTAILVIGDHGEADSGSHPPQITDASITSIILWGAGIKKGEKIPYSEHIDVAPTICSLLQTEPPETCQGRVIAEALSGFKGMTPPRKQNLKELIEQSEEYLKSEAEASLALGSSAISERARLYRDLNRIKQDFYDIHKFSEWPRFKTIENLLDNNNRVLDRLQILLDEITKKKNKN